MEHQTTKELKSINHDNSNGNEENIEKLLLLTIVETYIFKIFSEIHEEQNPSIRNESRILDEDINFIDEDFIPDR